MNWTVIPTSVLFSTSYVISNAMFPCRTTQNILLFISLRANFGTIGCGSVTGGVVVSKDVVVVSAAGVVGSTEILAVVGSVDVPPWVVEAVVNSGVVDGFDAVVSGAKILNMKLTNHGLVDNAR